ncbi:hypothetical protein CIP107563_00589 [Corynebacterium diphtheriae]|nr:hypothetical protein CIP107563_00589 [Corynebacterium diphtheriae]
MKLLLDQSLTHKTPDTLLSVKLLLDQSLTHKTPDTLDFYFEVPVDPKASNLEIKDNKIVEAEINTKDSSIVFEGHHGSLYSQLHNPYVTTKDNAVKASVSYVGYYVLGKNMTEYKDADRTEANKRSRRDTFGEVITAGWTLNETAATLSGSNMRYVPQPKTKDNVIDGVDVIFMGQYDGDYNSNLDDVKVDLKLKKVCKNEAEKPKAEYKKNESLLTRRLLNVRQQAVRVRSPFHLPQQVLPLVLTCRSSGAPFLVIRV